MFPSRVSKDMEIPKIRITIEEMRHTLVHHMLDYIDTYSDNIEKAINKFFDEFDLDQAVLEIMNQWMPRILEENIKSAMQSALYNREVSDKIAKIMLEKMIKRNKEEE